MITTRERFTGLTIRQESNPELFGDSKLRWTAYEGENKQAIACHTRLDGLLSLIPTKGQTIVMER